MFIKKSFQLQALLRCFIQDPPGDDTLDILAPDGDHIKTLSHTSDAISLIHILGIAENMLLHGTDKHKVTRLGHLSQNAHKLHIAVNFFFVLLLEKVGYLINNHHQTSGGLCRLYLAKDGENIFLVINYTSFRQFYLDAIVCSKL